MPKVVPTILINLFVMNLYLHGNRAQLAVSTGNLDFASILICLLSFPWKTLFMWIIKLHC